jgi:glycosyltransferase involved in cell wall biosynthesis
MPKRDVFVSVVASLDNAAEFVESFVAETHPILENAYSNFEIVLIDDRSSDTTITKVVALLSRYRCIRLIPLSRRLGWETAITAGLETAIGDFVVTMDPDTDPPGELVEMVELARGGHDVVVGVRDTTREHNFLYRTLRRAYYALCQWMVSADLIPGATRYRVLSRQAVNAVTQIHQRRRYFSMLISEIGYASTIHRYELICRSKRPVRPTILQSLREGSSFIVNNSNRPLRFVSTIGLLGSLLSVLYAGYIVMINLLLDKVAPGWTTLSFQLAGLFFLAFLILALVAKYMERILEEISDRPLYHAGSEQVSSVMLADEERLNVLHDAVSESPLRKRGDLRDDV